MTFIERQALFSIRDHFKFILQKYIVFKFLNEAALFYKFPTYSPGSQFSEFGAYRFVKIFTKINIFY